MIYKVRICSAAGWLPLVSIEKDWRLKDWKNEDNRNALVSEAMRVVGVSEENLRAWTIRL